MKLTDAEKAIIDPIVRDVANEYRLDDRNDIDPIPWEKANPNAVAGGILRAYLAGKRAGREDMIERAAKACQAVGDSHRPLDLQADESDLVIKDAVAAIRALGTAMTNYAGWKYTQVDKEEKIIDAIYECHCCWSQWHDGQPERHAPSCPHYVEDWQASPSSTPS